MGLFLLIAYLSLTYVRPWEYWPDLAEFRLPYWIGNLGLVVSVIRWPISGSRGMLRSQILWLLLGFMGLLILSPLVAGDGGSATQAAFTEFSVAIVGCVLLWLNVDSFAALRKTVIALSVLAVVLAVQCILAYHFGYAADKLVLEVFTEDALTGARTYYGRIRALGYLNDANDLAQALIVTAPLLWPAWRAGRRFWNCFMVVLPSIILLYAVFLTRSRGGLIAITFLVLMRVREKVKRFKVLAPVVISGLLMAALLGLGISGGREMSASDESAGGRMEAWRAGLQMMARHPMLGVGFNNFSDHHVRVAHNSFVHCFAELGLLGYFFWIGVLYSTYSTLTAISALDSPETARLAEWGTTIRFSLYAFLAGAFFLSRTYTPTLYLIVALAIAMVAIADKMQIPVPLPTWSQVLRNTLFLTVGSIVLVYILVTAAGF